MLRKIQVNKKERLVVPTLQSNTWDLAWGFCWSQCDVCCAQRKTEQDRANRAIWNVYVALYGAEHALFRNILMYVNGQQIAITATELKPLFMFLCVYTFSGRKHASRPILYSTSSRTIHSFIRLATFHKQSMHTSICYVPFVCILCII